MRKRPDASDFSGRSLAFVPVDSGAARTLAADQIECYNRQGYITGLPVFTPVEAAGIRAYIDDLLAAVLSARDGRDSYSVNSYHPVCAGLWDLATDARIVSLVTDIVGGEAVCWGTHLFAKLPHDGKEVPFHQDAIYWPFEPSRTATVWLAIDDVDTDNAAMQFVPGSHLDGPIAHEVLALDGTRVLGRRALGMDGRPQRVVNELSAGRASIHSDLLLHGSDANRSSRRRAGLTLRYAAASVRVLDGFEEWTDAAVHVGRGDPSGWWPNRARPDGDRPELMTTVGADAS
ncbi:MAG: phytanoyl-CoA dioxygenase family protein [Acidimicrobiia bacterium]